MADNVCELPDVSQLLCFSLYSTSHAFNRVYKPLLDQLGLTYPQYLAMTALWHKNDQTVGALGETLLLESSTLTPLLKRLEGLGFITRQRDSVDERQVRVRLTPSGQALKDKARDIPGCILESTGLPLERLIQLHKEISELRQNLLKAAS